MTTADTKWTPDNAAILDEVKKRLEAAGLSCWHLWGWCVARDIREDREEVYADDDGKVDPDITTGDMLAGAWEDDLDDPRAFVSGMWDGASEAHKLLCSLYPDEHKPATGY